MSSASAGSSRPDFEADDASVMLETLSLTSFLRNDYIIVTRPDFDVTVYGEPYIALMLFYNIKSGQYLARLWNKTLESGEAMTLEHLADICERHFLQRPLCLGCPESEEDVESCAFFISQSPFPRRISRACSGFMDESCTSNSTACHECAVMSSAESIKVEEAMENDVDETFEEETMPPPCWPKVEYGEEEQNHLIPSEEGEMVGHLESWEEFEGYQEDDVMLCNECNKVFKSKRSLYGHMKEKHRSAPEVHLCPECGASFGRKSNMRAHMRMNCKVGKRQPKEPKPPLTYLQLITEALRTAKDSTLPHSEICHRVSKKYAYYKLEDKDWQHCIGQHLSKNSMFEAVEARQKGKKGESLRGRSWTIKGEPLTNASIEPRMPQQPAEAIVEGIKVEAAMDDEDIVTETLDEEAMQGAYQMVECEYEEHPGTEWSGEERASTSHEQQENYNKPPFTYAQLILQALMTEKDLGLPLIDIYSFISQKYPYYKMENQTWQNAIRHNLTLNKGFEKVPNSKKGTRGKCWRMKNGFDFRGILKRRHIFRSSGGGAEDGDDGWKTMIGSTALGRT